ncbi:hypothetical protein H4582DRAFT_2052985 [Lactarius indigo]|nr:hypothetical protein H4582DRAFT_2052985 [Lactarius indigo]
MASGAVYPSSATWDYATGYPLDDPHPEYAPYPTARTLHQYPQHPHPHQVWTPPSRLSYDSYQDSPYMRHSPVPSTPASPPSLRHSLVDDPAFAPDPIINPDHWYGQRDMLSPPSFPLRSHSSSDLPPGFVPQSGPVSNLPGRSHSYHEISRGPSSVPQSVYFVPPSALSSSSTSDSSVSGSSALRTPSVPRSTTRSSDQVYEFPDSTFRSTSVTDVPGMFPDEGQSHPRNAKHRPKRRSTHAAEPANDYSEVSGAVVPSAENFAVHEDRTFRNVTSSAPPPSSLSERSKEGRARSSSRVNLADLDSIDELDETNPYGINIHHKGPYEAVAAILNETNPVDSPLLRIKGIQQQVSAGSPLRPSRSIQSEPNANPMSLNLKPGQILQSSIYQPMRPPQYPPDHYIPPSHAPTERSKVDYDAASVRSPLRRNQTLPVTNPAREPLEQSHHTPHPVRHEAQTHKRPYPMDPSIYQPQPPPSTGSQNSAHQPQLSRNTSETPFNPMPPHPYPQRIGSDQDARRRSSYNGPVPNIQLSSEPSTAFASPSEVPPSPDLDQRLSRTLYLTNPDHGPDSPNHRSRALPLAPEVIYPSRELRPEPPSQSHVDSFYGRQPPRASPPTETGRRRSPPRSSPPASSRAHHQETSRRYEPPSQTLAAMRAGHPSSVTSSSSSRAPRHVPKRLVMPTPLAASAENHAGRPPSSRVKDGDPRRPSQLLRKRSAPSVLPPPQRHHKPPQTVNRGVLSFLGFGKGSKPTVHQVRVTEPSKHVMSEKQQLRVPAHQEPRKLSKRR